VAGAIGPLGVRSSLSAPPLLPRPAPSSASRSTRFSKPAVDLLIFETFGNLYELREAVRAAHEAPAAKSPSSPRSTDRTISGHLPGGPPPKPSPGNDSWPVDAIGLNCSVGPKTTLETIERMMQFSFQAHERHAQTPGLPTARGRPATCISCSPEYMAQYARRLLWAGVRIIGGCCGTTPDHIRLIRSETARPAVQRSSASPSRSPRSRHRPSRPFPWREIQVGRQTGPGKFSRS